MLRATAVTKRFGGLVAVNKADLVDPQGIHRQPHRTQWRRQDDVLQRRRRHPRPDRWRDRVPRPNDGRTAPARMDGAVLLDGFRPSLVFVRSAWQWPHCSTGPRSRCWLVNSIFALVVLIPALLMAVIRPPVGMTGIVAHFGVFKSARPNDMVQAGIGRTFQNIRLFQNMTVARERAGRHARQAAQQSRGCPAVHRGGRTRGGGGAGPLPGTPGARRPPRPRRGHRTQSARTATSAGWRSPGPWPATRCCCCWTSRPRA